MKLYNEKMSTYAQLGYCYRIVRYHAVAVDYFKKQLELAWYKFYSKPLKFLCIFRELGN